MPLPFGQTTKKWEPPRSLLQSSSGTVQLLATVLVFIIQWPFLFLFICAVDGLDKASIANSDGPAPGSQTPPFKRKGKLSTIGKIFKPWKWRKKKTSDKFRETSAGMNVALWWQIAGNAVMALQGNSWRGVQTCQGQFRHSIGHTQKLTFDKEKPYSDSVLSLLPKCVAY